MDAQQRARFRRLGSSHDPQAYRDTVSSLRSQNPLAHSRNLHNRASVEAPRAVHVAEEGTSTVGELAARLQAGTLSLQDLVNVSGHWESFSECYHFNDTVESLLDRKRARRRVLVSALFLVVAAAVAWLVMRLAQLRG